MASVGAGAIRRAVFRGARATRGMAGAAAVVTSAAARPALSAASAGAAAAAFPRTAVAVGLGLGLGASAAAVYADSAMDSFDESKVRAAIEAILEEDPDMGPTIVRLAWHASGTYDVNSKTGGSDGATMRFSPESDHGANAGLNVARDALEPVKKQFPGISYSDLWTLSGVVAIQSMGGPAIAWRPGRVDKDSGEHCTPDGRLPDADKGQIGATVRHLREIFYRQGFNDQEIVALSGAHALGRCHANASGYDGPWTRAPTTFSNEYFRELLENTWTLKKWGGPDQFADPTGDLMMLPADMALLWDKDFRKYVEIYAKDEDKFFADFSAAFKKLEENGVKAFVPKKKGFLGLW